MHVYTVRYISNMLQSWKDGSNKSKRDHYQSAINRVEVRERLARKWKRKELNLFALDGFSGCKHQGLAFFDKMIAWRVEFICSWNRSKIILRPFRNKNYKLQKQIRIRNTTKKKGYPYFFKILTFIRLCFPMKKHCTLSMAKQTGQNEANNEVYDLGFSHKTETPIHSWFDSGHTSILCNC